MLAEAQLSPPLHVCFPRRGRRAEPMQIVLEHELSRDVAEATTELLQVLCCGEESAVFAFRALSRNAALSEAASATAQRIMHEEMFHDELLRGLRAVLPTPRPDEVLLGELKGFYRSLGTRDIFVHLSQICALDSGVCIVLSALREKNRPLGENRTLNALFGRIQRDEVGHVRDSGRLARELGPLRERAEYLRRTRERLTDLILQRADPLEALHVDPDALRRTLLHMPVSRR
jgi:hypothetical protein